MSRHSMRGFTIIELLIVIVIVSILVALAIPSYREYTLRGNRTVAKAALQELLAKQESYAGDHKGYALNFGRLGYGSATGTVYVNSNSEISASATGAIYEITLHGNADNSTCDSEDADNDPTALGFRLNADPMPVADEVDPKCGTICIASNGDRGTNGPSGVAECWRR